ncbi:hypothetical protein PHLGIDRAFT_35388 [Phlebiopsis gigantea 11061_1 CR5-6]|uniref:Peptidase A1 domain-containing protein n=1 Tax=Phlebiopsis gigantea (strain 11061_1 CR5-6) TaxID=745531 RepID=A0A0C3SB16_PHLG1|nr:hypothetical protein PHLGIDRAFT_35388 [Phlebiopsis gigantea 11061_1 CR5-6]
MAGRLIFPTLSLLSLSSLAAAKPQDGFSVISHVSNGGLSASQAGVGIGVDDSQDLQYNVNITLGGQQFEVILDSGSSDLWVMSNTSLKLTNDSGIATGISYGEGFVAGPIQFAELQLGPYTVPSQAFINVNESQDLGGAIGILGIAFDLRILDSTEDALKRAWGNDTTLGRTPLANILSQNQSIKPVFDVSLGRSSDLDEYSEGLFVIGQHAPQFAAVEQAPILPQVTDGRWSALVDGFSVNGQNFTFTTKSEVSDVPDGKLVAFLDTGTSLPEIPSEAVDFIYGSIPGSVSDNGTWYIPCQSGANLTWYLGGQAFPTNPLDLTILTNVTLASGSATGDDLDVTLCVGAYQPGTPPYPGIDMVLGDSFLRNVYVSFNFGQYDERTENGTGSYIQLLSTTNESDAWTDFLVSRSTALAATPFVVDPNILAQIPGALDSITSELGLGAPPSPPDADSTSSSVASVVPSTASPRASASAASGALADVAGGVTADPSSNSDAVASLLDKYGPVVIGLLAGNILVMSLLLIIALVACMRGTIRGGAKSRSLPANYVPVSFKDRVTEDAEFNAPVHSYGE